jgi:hypothetical protein
MGKYDSYFDGVSQRLSAEGFTIRRAVMLDPYQLDIVATKSAFEITKFGFMTRFVFGAGMESVDARTVEDFSSRSTKYALGSGSILPRGLGGSILSVTAMVSGDFSEGLKEWIGSTLAKRHWAAFEFPVLVSVNNRQIYYCKKTPLWGAAYYGEFRQFVEEQLRL